MVNEYIVYFDDEMKVYKDSLEWIKIKVSKVMFK